MVGKLIIKLTATISNRRSYAVIAFLGFVALASLLTVPISDIDLWWHLASGRYLLETKTFMTSDPFGLAGQDISQGRELILNGYWLAQIFFFSIYEIFGDIGIVLLRVLLLLTPTIAVLFFGWKRSLQPFAILFVAILCGWGMLEVDGIRPNHITIALVPILFILLERLGYPTTADYTLGYRLRLVIELPVFMLLWANLHGGFLLGSLILAVYATAETAATLLRRQSVKPLIFIWCMVGIAILATLLSPNGALTYIEFVSFTGGVIQQKTSEYLSPWVLAQNGAIIYWPYFIFTALCAVVLAFRAARMPATKLMLILALFIISVTAFRYVPLFIAGTSILLLTELDVLARTIRWTRLVTTVGSIVLACYLFFSAILAYPTAVEALVDKAVNENRFPIAAVDFINENRISGVVFNHFNWGGYLAWRQSDSLRTFVDGRSLNMPLFHEYTRVLWLPNKMQSILDRRGVNLIVIPRLNPFTGELYALTDFLWREKSWELVYRDSTGMVLVRQADYPNLTRLGKSLIYQDVLNDIEMINSTSGRNGLEKIASFARMRLDYGQ